MAEDSTVPDAVRAALNNPSIPQKIVNSEKEIHDKDLKKGKEPVASKNPEMNLAFLFGFVGTILVGSFHYGSLGCLL